MDDERDGSQDQDAWELLVDGPGATCVLFDFDGPLCRLFPFGTSMAVAADLRRTLADDGAIQALSAAERTDKDPYMVLRAIHRVPQLGDLVRRLDARLTEGELVAVSAALPTAGADRLVRWLSGRGVRLAVVTNNAADAADRYLRRHDLRGCFEAIHGRGADPGLMKPHPDVLRRALSGLGLPAGDAVMIGDTPADFAAAEEAGVAFIGYGRSHDKRRLLREAGAKIVIASYEPLLLRAASGAEPGAARDRAGVDGPSSS
ncbi:HAD family hydrolase [Streptomyces sp. NPDC027717]|uniref:HAD family hydrolase n=1 Tax=Streptomyces sp. NPDC027717 TaxID=3155765 RepID=UPI0033C03FF5